jgi:hypothetical protein
MPFPSLHSSTSMPAAAVNVRLERFVIPDLSLHPSL